MSRPPPSVCPLCRLAPRMERRLPDGAPLRQCPRCRLAWWDWPPFDPAEFYDREYFASTTVSKGYDDYAALEAGLRRTSLARLRRIARLRGTPAGGRLLDVGCATGIFLEQAAAQGWDGLGLEVSPHAADAARSRGLRVDRGPFDESAARGPFECITLWDVIEHLDDPVAAMRRVRERLVMGGLCALSTGNVDSWCARLSGRRWHLFNLPEHLFFFSRPALRELLESSGFRLRAVRREVNWIPMHYAVERLSKSLTGRTRRLVGSIGDRLLPATLGDVLGVYAERVR